MKLKCSFCANQKCNIDLCRCYCHKFDFMRGSKNE